MGDADVNTAGTLVKAFNTGTATSTTVNGVLFSGTQNATIASGGSVTFGTGAGALTLSTAGGTAIFYSNGSATTISAAYELLTESSFYIQPTTTLTLQFSGLTLGQAYQVQIFSNDSQGQFNNRTTTFTSGNAVTLDSITTVVHTSGGLGQFTTGTFAADAATQTITMTSSSNLGYISGIQLRAVPEPSSLALMACGLGGIILVRRCS